ncbi:MAG: hypothetical protein M1837_004769 [Sclerophora amabilis]|nr:MAG: hypothetical protein M1837_004769 [Sclerophora amabilis]
MINWRGHRRVQVAYNHFVLLVYNLILANLQQSLAFLMSLYWLVRDELVGHTPVCFAQGWFVSTGDLASGIWILAVAAYTFLSVLKGCEIRCRNFGVTACLLWAFVYLLALIGVILHPQDLYVPTEAWCWVSERYQAERLFLQYLWIFIADFGTIVIFALLHVIMRRRRLNRGRNERSDAESQTIRRFEQAARYMIIYPVIHVVLTLPLTAGRIAAMSGRNPPVWYYCFAGTMTTSCGFFNVVCYWMTRRVIFHNSPVSNNHSCGMGPFGTSTIITVGPKGGERLSGRDDARGRNGKLGPFDSTASHIFRGVITETSFTVTSEAAVVPVDDWARYTLPAWSRET